MSGQKAFVEAIEIITTRIAGRNLDDDLQSFLNESFPPGGEAFDDVATLCRQGIDEGWLCTNHQTRPGNEWILGRRRGDGRYCRAVARAPER